MDLNKVSNLHSKMFVLFQEHFSGAKRPGFGSELCLQLHTWVLIGTNN